MGERVRRTQINSMLNATVRGSWRRVAKYCHTNETFSENDITPLGNCTPAVCLWLLWISVGSDMHILSNCLLNNTCIFWAVWMSVPTGFVSVQFRKYNDSVGEFFKCLILLVAGRIYWYIMLMKYCLFSQYVFKREIYVSVYCLLIYFKLETIGTCSISYEKRRSI